MNHWLLRLFFVAFLLIAVGWQTAVAQSNPLASQAEFSYGQVVTFRLTGQIDTEIERIDLFVAIAQSDAPFIEEVQFTQDESGQLVAGFELTREILELPPFARVRFWWELQTADSETILIPEKTFLYQDDRFAWRELSQGDVEVRWTGNSPDLGQLAWEIVADSRQTLDDILPQTAVSPLNVYIYPATADLRAGLRLAGRDWLDGHSDPDLGVLLVTAVNPLTAAADLRQTIPHELTHLRLHQLAPNVSLPFWYEEGMALLAEENGVVMDEVLTTAVVNETTQTLLLLCTNFPTEAPDSELALAQSVSLLRYIQGQFGNQALRQLGAAYLDGTGCEAGLTQTLDMPLAELNADWLRAQQPQPAWRTFLSQNGLWLLLLLGSFGLLALSMKR